MDKAEAETLYDSGREATVEKILEYDRENRELKEKIAQLESNSGNSSKPPSSDSPKDKEKRKQETSKKSSTRKPGGQPGHKGKKRELIPVEECDEVIPCYPEECKNCKLFVECKQDHVIGEVYRWQQTEIPPIQPTVTEYQVYTLSGKCGAIHNGSLPADVARSSFGPRLTGIIAYFTSVLHVSRRALKECLETLLGVRLSLGSVQNLLEETSQALEPIDRELKETLPRQPVINGDETGWYKRWLWIFVVSSFIYFHVAVSRGSIVLKEVLGERYEGILGVDRWGAYTKYHKGKLQICWEHLKRNFRGVKEIGQKTESSEAVEFAERMEKLRKKMMALWYRFKDGELTRQELIEKTRHIRYLIGKCLKEYRMSSQRRVKVLSGNLLKLKKHLFTFIFHEGVEPTNNIAERGIRPAVQWRKICFGNRSDVGAVLTSRLLTVTRTCWLRKQNSLEFLVSVITSFRKSTPSPSFL